MNIVGNLKVIQGMLGSTPDAIRLTPIVPIYGSRSAEEVRKSLDVLAAFIDSVIPQIAEEEGEVTWEDVAWQ